MITTWKDQILNVLVEMRILLCCCFKREKSVICICKTLGLLVLLSPFSYIYIYIYKEILGFRRDKIQKKWPSSSYDPLYEAYGGAWPSLSVTYNPWMEFLGPYDPPYGAYSGAYGI